VWVAACDRAWLKAHLQALAQAGHAASRIVPEFTPEITAQTLYVLDQADRAMLVGGGALQSVSLLLCPLSAATVALMDDESASAVRLEVVAEPAVAVLAEELFKRPVTLMQRPQRWLQAAQTPWDLAQFDLLNANRDRAVAHMVQGLNSLVRAPQWRAARFALLLLLVANLIGLNAWAWREQASLNTSRLAVRNVLMQTFPKIPAVVDAPVQMAREVAALQRASGTPSGSDMESMLAKFGVAAPDGLALTAIDYVAQELRVKTPPMALKDQDRLVLTLKQQGLSAAWDGAQWVIKPGAAP
jgi:general secretion pathway protein L